MGCPGPELDSSESVLVCAGSSRKCHGGLQLLCSQYDLTERGCVALCFTAVCMCVHVCANGICQGLEDKGGGGLQEKKKGRKACVTKRHNVPGLRFYEG